MTDRDDASIPTLTIRASPEHEPPVLTDVAHTEDTDSDPGHRRNVQAPVNQSLPPWDVEPPRRTWTAPASHSHVEDAARSTTSTPAGRTSPGSNATASTPSDAVLRAALQADIEDAVQNALDEALHQVKARLEAELPDIVARAVRRTRVG